MEEMPPSLKTDIFSKCEAEQRNIQGPDTLSDKEKKILSLLKMDAATHFDKLFLESGCSIPDLSEQLMNLELKGLIRRLPGDMYIR